MTEALCRWSRQPAGPLRAQTWSSERWRLHAAKRTAAQIDARIPLPLVCWLLPCKRAPTASVQAWPSAGLPPLRHADRRSTCEPHSQSCAPREYELCLRCHSTGRASLSADAIRSTLRRRWRGPAECRLSSVAKLTFEQPRRRVAGAGTAWLLPCESLSAAQAPCESLWTVPAACKALFAASRFSEALCACVVGIRLPFGVSRGVRRQGDRGDSRSETLTACRIDVR
eukprot:2924467-Prymnesium_polylepis.1